jgi:hypothetical protein
MRSSERLKILKRALTTTMTANVAIKGNSRVEFERALYY